MGNVKKARGAPPEPDLPPAPTPGKQTDMERLRLRPDPATKITGDGPMFEGEPAFGTGFVTVDDVAKFRRFDEFGDYVRDVILLPYAYQIGWGPDTEPEHIGFMAQRAARFAWEAVEKAVLEHYNQRAKHMDKFVAPDGFSTIPGIPVRVYQGIEKGKPLLLLHPDDFDQYIKDVGWR